MSLPKIFIVDDNEMYAAALVHTFKRDLFDISVFHTGADYLRNLDHSVDIAVVDYMLPDTNGLELLKKSLQLNPELAVIILSGSEDIKIVSPLYKHGAHCFIVKSESSNDELAHKVRNLLNRINMRKEVALLEEEILDRGKYDRIIGNSEATLRMLKMIQRVEKTNANVMITGESGTGKELVAKAVHYNSNRKRKAFVAVNIAAIPNNLIEAELFGHEKGAFTGAVGKRIGKFEEAQNGTIFLDEIGELELGLQAKLLRVLQERKMSRLGSNKEINLDIRIITATHRNLAQQVREGHFREDLYYRIQGFPIQVPELCDRDEDILLLAKHFLIISAKKNNMPAREFSEAAQKMLMRHRWPGNVRELISVMEHVALLCDSQVVSVDDIVFTQGTKNYAPEPIKANNNNANSSLDSIESPEELAGLYKKLAQLKELEPMFNMLKKSKILSNT